MYIRLLHHIRDNILNKVRNNHNKSYYYFEETDRSYNSDTNLDFLCKWRNLHYIDYMKICLLPLLLSL